jgi:hypothetical protein
VRNKKTNSKDDSCNALHADEYKKTTADKMEDNKVSIREGRSAFHNKYKARKETYL